MKKTWLKVLVVIAALFVSGIKAQSAQAQTIRYEVKVSGYNGGDWIELRVGSGTGGEVVTVKGDGKGKPTFYTDRVSRGEELRVIITDRGNRQCEVRKAIVGVVADNGFAQGAIVSLPFTRDFKVSRDPSFDNVTAIVGVLPNGAPVTLRIPIGTRPVKK